LVQQTPSAQNPPVHWLLPEQVAPAAFLGTQVLLVRSQNDPVTQFPSAVQAEGRQVVPFMQATPPGQAAEVGAPRAQLPAPSQLAGVVVSWLPVHDEVPVHAVPEAARAQARLPLQKPVAPQMVVPNEQSLSALLPLGSAVQTPSVPRVLLATQDSQIPLQSLSQQTWSELEQTPLAHCAVNEQAAPGDSFGLQLWVAESHMRPAPHSASPLQLASAGSFRSVPPSMPLEPWPPVPPVVARPPPPPPAPLTSVPPSLVPYTKLAEPQPRISATATTSIKFRRWVVLRDKLFGYIRVVNTSDLYNTTTRLGG
jgi:hypothetical protein